MGSENPQPNYEQKLLALLQRLSLDVASAESVNEAFKKVLEHICQFMEWPLGHVYIWSEGANALVSSRIWYMTDASTIVPFRQLSEATQFRRGEGTLGQVWESGEAITILDVQEEPIFLRSIPVKEGGIRAYFAFPVLVNNEVLAVLEFFSPMPNAPDQDMTSVINHVGALLGLTMRRQQSLNLLQESELKLAHTVRQLSALMEIGQSVSSVLDLDVIYKQVLKLVRPLIGAELLLIFLHNSENNTLQIVDMDQDQMLDMRGMRIPDTAGIAGNVWQNGESLFLKGDDCTRLLSAKLQRLSGYQPQSMLAVPVRFRDTSVGVIEATHRDEDAFSDADLRMLETAAAWTAIAVGNSIQYEQIKRRLQESDAISTISTALTQTLELEALLKIIVDHVQGIIADADWAAIHLLNSSTNQLELVASTGLEISPDAYLIAPGAGIAGMVMSEGDVSNVDDVQTDPQRLPIDLSMNARSLLVAPVESRQKRLGTISVHCATPGAFTDEDERLLTILGVQAGMAIENATLFESQQRARKIAEKRRERMKQMAQAIVQAEEKERARIARELHDEAGQSLTSLKISLDLIRSALPEDLTDIKESLNEILLLVDKTMSNLRLLSHNLRPPGLDAYGLHAALEGLCHDFEKHTDLTINYEGQDLPDLAPLITLTLYRCAQEGLTNVAKHAQATKVLVTMSEESDMIILKIVDDGKGFTPPNLDENLPVQGAGLVGIVERLEMVEGQIKIDSSPGTGSRLTAVVPYVKGDK